jgi:hypothetical protein
MAMCSGGGVARVCHLAGWANAQSDIREPSGGGPEIGGRLFDLIPAGTEPNLHVWFCGHSPSPSPPGGEGSRQGVSS